MLIVHHIPGDIHWYGQDKPLSFTRFILRNVISMDTFMMCRWRHDMSCDAAGSARCTCNIGQRMVLLGFLHTFTWGMRKTKIKSPVGSNGVRCTQDQCIVMSFLSSFFFIDAPLGCCLSLTWVISCPRGLSTDTVGYTCNLGRRNTLF